MRMQLGQDAGTGGGTDYDSVTMPDGRIAYVPKGYGQQAQAMANRMGSPGGGGGGGGSGMIGNFADGFEAVQKLMAGTDMQGDLDSARDTLAQLDIQRDLYAAQLDTGSNPAPSMTLGQRWKLIQKLQDDRDFYQERVLSSQIRLNYGSGLAAAGRVAGRLMDGSGGGSMGGMNNTDILLGVGGLGLGLLLLRDRSGTSVGTTPARYSP